MLKQIKTTVLRATRAAGGLALTGASAWRRSRLLVLCYHGISLDDEHEWNPNLYLSPAVFRQRLGLLRTAGCTVLPLDEAIQALRAGTLPDRAVTLTFDDGHYDFHHVARPILSEFGYPSTVYLTTYHSDCNIPIFALISSYMLWKARTSTLDLGALTGGSRVQLDTADRRRHVLNALVAHVVAEGMSALEKNQIAERLAHAVGIDFFELCHRRMLHLVNPAEVQDLAGSGVDFQMHTHCHRSPREEGLYREQVRRNSTRIEELTGRRPTHFCYPSGETAPEFIGWLAAEGVQSAVTCVPGLANRASPLLLLPRLLDHSSLSPVEFEGWITGFSSFLPGRPASHGEPRS